MYRFLWNSNVDKIKRKQTTQKYPKGGLNMIGINNYIQGLKSSWIKKLLNDQKCKMDTIIKHIN
jgi:hypothetical protein